ncbi:MAG: hypothetical protein II191_01375, partial [Clostridia bacterium]|nr:hypothetical protein [Clostridia bacterium]
TMADALLIMRYAMDIGEYTDEQIAMMDFDGDGEITTVDALLYMRAVMNIN